MRRGVIHGAVLMLPLVAAIPATAQEMEIPDTPEVLHLAPEPSDRFPAKWYPRVGDGTDVAAAPVLDRPYTAVVETMYPSRSVSGETTPYVTYGFAARDRSGRTRSESVTGGMTIGDESIKIKTISVADPVSHCEFEWHEAEGGSPMPSEMQVAMVTCGPRTLRYKDLKSLFSFPEDGVATRGDTTTQTERLPPLQIDGVTVDRLRVTNSSRDEKGTVKKWVTETWYSHELQELIRQGDEESGYTMLTGIKLADPDPKLFYPPEGWKIEVRAPR